ncbi:MAG: type II toxin-antitoxin system RelE/ParE family toxin [Gammaproteobacteria bacterium]|nr:type II toxin-antitoxin system RelE/ParE family toxin [Gammaproteobacteria bacterium]
MRLEWTEPVLADLETINDYIAQDSPTNANRFVDRLFTAADSLTDSLRIGRPVPEADDASEEFRELIFGDYRIIYRVVSGRVQVLAVIT